MTQARIVDKVFWNNPNNPPSVGKRVKLLLKDNVVANDAAGSYEFGPCIWNGRTWLYCDVQPMAVITRRVLGWRENI